MSTLHPQSAHQSSASLLSTGSNPFRDPSVDLPRHSLSAYSSRETSQSQPHSRSPSRSPPAPFSRPAFASRPSEIQRQLNLALEEDLPLSPVTSVGGDSVRSAEPRQASIRPAHRPPPKGGKDGLLAQLRKGEPNQPQPGPTCPSSTCACSLTLSLFLSAPGTGWFAPVVPPEPPLTKQEAERQNQERIAKIRDLPEGKNYKRPNFIKRMSSGVEMLGFGGDAKPTQPSKNARGRGQSLSEGVAQ